MIEIYCHPCIQCGHQIPKKQYESFNRHKDRKFDSLKCAKAYFKKNEIGWYSEGIHTINKSKKEELPPMLMTDQELKEFYDSVPELAYF